MRRLVWMAVAMAAAPGALAAQVGSPAGPVPVDVLERRRAALLDRVGDGVIVVRSAELRSIEGDYPQDSDYRENNGFFYLTGLEAPGGVLVMVASRSKADEVRLYLPPRDRAAERWTGPRLGPDDEARRLTGITDVRSAELVEREVAQLTRGAEPVDVEPVLASLRLVKDAEEMRRLERAIELTVDAHRAAARALEPGMWEYELEAIIEFTFRAGGAERVGFPSIVGSGPNSTVLHYDRSRRRMEAGDLVVVDIGAEWGYYSADVTRTYPVSGTFTARQRAIYDLVLGAQEAALAKVRPGVTIAQLYAAARGHMEANSGDLCGAESCARFFVHGLSHWLGMDVHDVGSYDEPLRPGMVLTVEPGIYIPEESLGVRIEDDVLVTETGYELLSDGAPRRAEDVERLMRESRDPARPLR